MRAGFEAGTERSGVTEVRILSRAYISSRVTVAGQRVRPPRPQQQSPLTRFPHKHHRYRGTPTELAVEDLIKAIRADGRVWTPNSRTGCRTSAAGWSSPTGETETDWTYDYNLDLARTAESVGFDYALAQARFFGSYGADKQLEALSIANALAAQTDELHVIGAVHPGCGSPARWRTSSPRPTASATDGSRSTSSPAGLKGSSPDSASRGSNTTSGTPARRSSSRC